MRSTTLPPTPTLAVSSASTPRERDRPTATGGSGHRTLSWTPPQRSLSTPNGASTEFRCRGADGGCSAPRTPAHPARSDQVRAHHLRPALRLSRHGARRTGLARLVAVHLDHHRYGRRAHACNV